MSVNDIFFDSSALIAGMISSEGASRALLLLSENGKIASTVSEQVVAEVERNIARKAPKILPYVREMILRAHIRIVRDPSPNDVRQHPDWISHLADAPILVAAVQAQVYAIATLNTRHFIDDPRVAQLSGLRIGTPGDVLGWVRAHPISH